MIDKKWIRSERNRLHRQGWAITESGVWPWNVVWLAFMGWVISKANEWEDPLEKAMAPHSSTLAWKIPWTEERGRLQSMRSQSQTWLSDFTSMNGKFIPTILGKGWRFPGVGPPYTFWSLMVSLGTVMAPVGVSLNLLTCYNEHIQRLKIWWMLTLLD